MERVGLENYLQKGKSNLLRAHEDFFSITGIKTTRHDEELDPSKSPFSWNQPFMVQGAKNVETTNGETIPVSGMVFLLVDPKDRVFLSVEQEPGARDMSVGEKVLKPIVRSPLQTSVAKLEG